MKNKNVFICHLQQEAAPPGLGDPTPSRGDSGSPQYGGVCPAPPEMPRHLLRGGTAGMISLPARPPPPLACSRGRSWELACTGSYTFWKNFSQPLPSWWRIH